MKGDICRPVRFPRGFYKCESMLVCLFSYSLPLTKCLIMEAAAASAVPAAERTETFKVNKSPDGVIREMLLNGCRSVPTQSASQTPVRVTAQDGQCLTFSASATRHKGQHKQCNHTSSQLQRHSTVLCTSSCQQCRLLVAQTGKTFR